MRMKILATLGLFALGAVAGHGTPASVPVSASAAGPQMTSIGPMTFGPSGGCLRPIPQAATIYALELGDKASSGGKARGRSTQSIRRSRRCSAPTPRSRRHRPGRSIRARRTRTSR